MDWSRAKSLLIVAFLFLNLFLGWQYAQSQAGYVTEEPGADTAAQLEEMLRLHQVVLTTEIPEEKPEAPVLYVKYRELKQDKDQFLHRLLGENENLRRGAALVEHLPLFESYAFDPLLSTEESWIYYQRLDETLIFSAPLFLDVEGDLWQEYLGVYVQEEGRSEAQRLLSARQTLYSLLENRYIPVKSQLEQVVFGYYGHFFDADVQVLTPVWRVIYLSPVEKDSALSAMSESSEQSSSDGELRRQVLYVNAITGRVEVVDRLESVLPLPDNGEE